MTPRPHRPGLLLFVAALASVWCAAACSSSPRSAGTGAQDAGAATAEGSDAAVASGGDDGDAGDDAAVDGPAPACATDPRAESYAAGLAKPGGSGAFTFVLASAMPAPPSLYSNTWNVSVVDGSGQPVQNASVTTIKLYMPQMRHGSSVRPTITPNGNGTFTIAPLYFQMAGLWQITITAQANSMTDSAMFTFCVRG
jgi:hypothetical protein